MRTFKIIIGIVLGLFSLITIVQVAGEESGAGLAGAITGFIIFEGIAIWLIYSATNKNLEVINNQNPTKSYNPEVFLNDKENLSDLRRNGILTEEEYDKKLEEIQNTNLEVQIKLTDDYKKLKSLFDNGVLTKDEFESKILVLKMMLKSTEQTKKTYSENEKEFTVTEEISEGYYVIMDDDFNYGFADINLDKIIDTTYEFADSFKEGLALVRLNDKFGFINSNNDIIISIKYDDAKNFENGIAEVCNGENWFFIDKIGQKH
jgi:hypothetical protein